MPSNQVTTATPAKFETLPAEIRLTILELACKANLEEYCSSRSAQVERRGFQQLAADILLAPIHVSKGTRALARKHSQCSIWRSLAALTAVSYGFRLSRSTKLLSILAKRSENTLDCLDLRRLSRYSRLMLESLKLAKRSSETLQELHMIYYAPGFPSPEVRAAIFGALNKGLALKALGLDCYPLPTSAALLKLAETVQASPTSLRLGLDLEWAPSQGAWLFFSKLITNVKKLEVCGPPPRDPNAQPLAPSWQWGSLLIVPICSNLIQLRLHVTAAHFKVMNLFRQDFPVLEQLSIKLFDTDCPPYITWVERSNITIKQLSSLSSVEAPIGLLSSFEAPALQSLVATHVWDYDANICMEFLRRSPEVKDLVLHHRPSVGIGEHLIKDMLASLTPDKGLPYVCRRLERLSILIPTQTTSALPVGRLLQNSFLAFDKIERGSFSSNGHRMPIIGLDLLGLVQQRQKFFSEVEGLMQSETNKTVQIETCAAFKTVRVLDCCFFDGAWGKIISVAQKVENFWLLPLPLLQENGPQNGAAVKVQLGSQLPRRSLRLADRVQG